MIDMESPTTAVEQSSHSLDPLYSIKLIVKLYLTMQFSLPEFVFSKIPVVTTPFSPSRDLWHANKVVQRMKLVKSDFFINSYLTKIWIIISF